MARIIDRRWEGIEGKGKCRMGIGSVMSKGVRSTGF